VTSPEKAPDSPDASTTPEKSPSKRRNYSIRFLRNSDRIDASDPETQRSLNELRDYLVNGCENARVTIEGHTSAEGSAEHNQSLSELRAQAVKSLLLQQGVTASKISGTVGYGATVPLVREPDERSRRRMSPLLLENLRRQNRRITLREDVSCD
jgi:OOP family OmpA-OmpF porin